MSTNTNDTFLLGFNIIGVTELISKSRNIAERRCVTLSRTL